MILTSASFLRKFSKIVVFSTLFLIFLGALIKSHEVGLSVPDWPSSYGYNMFTFPISQWVGGIFYEHGHRLFATIVGFLTLSQSLLIAFSNQPLWLKKTAFIALFLVILQGMLGGITVLFYLPPIVSMAHGVLAQTFFVVTIFIAYSLSNARSNKNGDNYSKELKSNALLFCGLIYMQLILGALMRHTASGLAIPDFPTMGGQWLPTFSDKMMNNINVILFENDLDLVIRAQSLIHFLHRLGAVVVSSFLIYFFVYYRSYFNHDRLSSKIFNLIIFVIAIQVALGVSTVMSQKAPFIASFHVVTGAALLGLSVLLYLNLIPNELRRRAL